MTCTNLTITSLNVNGLSDEKKRTNAYQFLKNKTADIILLQETHSTKENQTKRQKEWKGLSIWHSGTKPKSSGVAILFKENLNIAMLQLHSDAEGRIISLTFLFENQTFNLVNVYAPTKNSKQRKSFKKLQKYIYKNNNIIVGGDFNMVEDLTLDRQGGTPNNTHLLGIEYVRKIKETNNLIDIWRKKNLNKKQFTYHNYDYSIHSRIDRIYVNKNQNIKKIEIFPNSYSDHAGIIIKINIDKNKPRGKGIWKLNTSIIKHKTFKKLFQNFWQDWQQQKHKYNYINSWWETGKNHFKMFAMQFSKEKNQNINNKQKQLTQLISEEKLKEKPNQHQIQVSQNTLENIENYKADGSVIRNKEKL